MSTSNDLPSLYDNKENIQEHPEIPDINKITASDMNTIKALLNNATYINIENLKNVNNETINPKIPRYEEKNYIVLSLNAKQNISQGNYNVNFTTAENEGSTFEFDSSKVKVLKDCKALISGNVFIDGSLGDGYIWGRIYVNDVEITNHLERIINRDFTQASIPAIAVDLKANDVINMKIDYGSTAGNPSIRNGKANTFLSVVEI